MGASESIPSQLRALPFSEASEKGLLCSLLRAPGAVADLCRNRVPVDAFAIPAHAIIFELVHEWTKPDLQVDFVWLIETLRNRNQLEECGGKVIFDPWNAASRDE